MRRREGGRRVYGRDELERLSFIRRLKSLGLSLEEIREPERGPRHRGLHPQPCWGRLNELLEGHLEARSTTRVRELMDLRDEIQKYRDHVAARIAGKRRR